MFTYLLSDPINGGYTVWSNWTACPISCGPAGAVQTRTRSCTNPAPLHHGLSCLQQSLGPTFENRPCGNDPCPGL